MGIEALLTEALKQGGVVGLVVVAVVLLIGGMMRLVGISAIGSKSQLVDEKKFDAVAAGVTQIAGKLEGIEKRMAHVESDVEHRATRAEVHALELSFTRMEGRFESIDARTSATANGVSRIEEFMYAAAVRAKGEK